MRYQHIWVLLFLFMLLAAVIAWVTRSGPAAKERKPAAVCRNKLINY
jgi:cbb3-type cytochrome oxidase subunit 3